MTFRFISALGLENSTQELENPRIASLILGCMACPWGRKECGGMGLDGMGKEHKGKLRAQQDVVMGNA